MIFTLSASRKFEGTGIGEILPQIFNLGEDAEPQPAIIDVISSSARAWTA
jgi:hypothetical protein